MGAEIEEKKIYNLIEWLKDNNNKKKALRILKYSLLSSTSLGGLSLLLFGNQNDVKGVGAALFLWATCMTPVSIAYDGGQSDLENTENVQSNITDETKIKKD